MSSINLVLSAIGNCAWSNASRCTNWAIKKVAGDSPSEKSTLKPEPKLLPEPEIVFSDIENSLKKLVRNLTSAHPDSLNNQDVNNPQIKVRRDELSKASEKQRKDIPLNAQIFGISYFASSISGLAISPGDLLQKARKKDPNIEQKSPSEFQRQIWNECSSMIRTNTRRLFLKRINREIAEEFLKQTDKTSIDELSQEELLNLKSKFKNTRDLTFFQEQKILYQTVWNKFLPYIAFHFFAPILSHLIPKVTEFVLKQTSLIAKNNTKNIQKAYSDILIKLLITYSGLAKTATAEEINTRMKEKFISLLENETSFETIINIFIANFRKEFPLQVLLNTFIRELINSNTAFQIVLGYCLYPLKFITYLPILLFDKALDYSLEHLQNVMEKDKKQAVIKLYSFLFPLITNLEIIQDAKTWDISEKTQIDRSCLATIVDKSEKYSLEIVKYAQNNYELLKKDYIKLISKSEAEELLQIEGFAGRAFDLMDMYKSWSLPTKNTRKERISTWIPSFIEGALDKALMTYDGPLTNDTIELTLYNCLNNTLLKGIHKQDLAVKEEYRKEMSTFINTLAANYIDPLFQVKDTKQLKEKENIFFRKMRESFSLKKESPFKTFKEKCESIATEQSSPENLFPAFKEAEESFFHTLLAYQRIIQNPDTPGKSRNKFQKVGNYLLHINELLKTKKPQDAAKILDLLTKISEFANTQTPSKFDNPNTLKLLYFLTRPMFFISMPAALTYAAANEITNSYYDRNISSLIFDTAPGYLKQAYDFTLGYLNEDQQKKIGSIESAAQNAFSFISPCLKTVYDTGNSLLGYAEKSIRQTPSTLLSSDLVKKGTSHIIETSIDVQDNPTLIYQLATILLKEVLNKDKLP